MRSFIYFVLFVSMSVALVSGSNSHAQGAKAAKKAVRQPAVQLAAMGFQAPQQKGGECRTVFYQCLRSCSGGEGGGCIMGCETDCAVCNLEATGAVDAKACER